MSSNTSESFDFTNASFGTSELFIGISGLIGAGKTTLAEALSKKLGLPTYYEPVIDNIYLQDFYKDMHKYAFPLQVFLLNKRFKQQQQIVWGGKGGVQDRTIYEDSVFARMLRDGGYMDERDYSTYIELFKNMSNFMKKPNIIVHLDVKPAEAMERIRTRARGCETGITVEYLEALYAAYDVFITEIARVIPVIRVDYSEFRTADEMATRIVREYERIANIRNVTWNGGSPSPATKKTAAAAGAALPRSTSGSDVEGAAADMSLVSGADTPSASPAKVDRTGQFSH